MLSSGTRRFPDEKDARVGKKGTCVTAIEMYLQDSASYESSYGFSVLNTIQEIAVFSTSLWNEGIFKIPSKKSSPLKNGKSLFRIQPQQHNGQLSKLAKWVKIPRSTSEHYVKLGNEIYSTIRTPNDHQSALWLWPRLFTTSGAMYSTVPQKE